MDGAIKNGQSRVIYNIVPKLENEKKQNQDVIQKTRDDHQQHKRKKTNGVRAHTLLHNSVFCFRNLFDQDEVDMLIKAVSGSDAFFKNSYAVCKCLCLFSQFRNIYQSVDFCRPLHVQKETTVLTRNVCFSFIQMLRCVVLYD